MKKPFFAFLMFLLLGLLAFPLNVLGLSPQLTSGNFRFVALGDTGSGTPMQKAVASQMLAYHAQHPFPLVLHLGDILYPDGNIQTKGESLYKNMYQPLMAKGVKFRVVLGNHDVLRGFNPKALSFYEMPGRYYHFTSSDPKKLVDFFALDTNIMDNKAQQVWLEKALAQSHAPWKIVYGHHPLYSSGEHGTQRSLVKILTPIFQKYGVAFYLSGHEHDYERFEPIQGTVYLVSGGGGAYLRKFPKILPHSLVRKTSHHFLSFQVSQNQVVLDVIDTQGKPIDHTVFQKSKN